MKPIDGLLQDVEMSVEQKVYELLKVILINQYLWFKWQCNILNKYKLICLVYFGYLKTI